MVRALSSILSSYCMFSLMFSLMFSSMFSLSLVSICKFWQWSSKKTTNRRQTEPEWTASGHLPRFLSLKEKPKKKKDNSKRPACDDQLTIGNLDFNWYTVSKTAAFHNRNYLTLVEYQEIEVQLNTRPVKKRKLEIQQNSTQLEREAGKPPPNRQLRRLRRKSKL